VPEAAGMTISPAMGDSRLPVRIPASVIGERFPVEDLPFGTAS